MAAIFYTPLIPHDCWEVKYDYPKIHHLKDHKKGVKYGRGVNIWR